MVCFIFVIALAWNPPKNVKPCEVGRKQNPGKLCLEEGSVFCQLLWLPEHQMQDEVWGGFWGHRAEKASSAGLTRCPDHERQDRTLCEEAGEGMEERSWKLSSLTNDQ